MYALIEGSWLGEAEVRLTRSGTSYVIDQGEHTWLSPIEDRN